MLIDAIGSEKPAITSAELLDHYDCVISIGKTVQYCLVQGIPVFLYDRFGGPGYLNESNYDLPSITISRGVPSRTAILFMKP